jgi:hypothetical protein
MPGSHASLPTATATTTRHTRDRRPPNHSQRRPVRVRSPFLGRSSWLAILSAPTPAGINADGTVTPYFTNVLAWVFYFDDLPPMCPAGGPAASGSAEPIQCDPASLGPSSAILSVDATTAEPLTNVESGAPMLP